MIESNRTLPSNFMGAVAIAFLAVWMTGCAQLTARLPPLIDPAHHARTDNAFQPPSESSVAAPDSSTIRFDESHIDVGTPENEIQQVAHNQRHVARQVPNNPQQVIPYGSQPANPAAQNFGQTRVTPPQPNVLSQTNYAQQPPVVPGAGVAFPPIGPDPVYSPNVRYADLILNGYPGRTGRITFGAAVNSDAGITGQITIDERNFDIFRFPRSFQDFASGNAFRGKGQSLRIEAVPGSDFDRYIVNFSNPNLFTYMPISMSVGGFLYDRRFDDWDEERLGGRVSLGYRLTPDLSLSVGVSGQNVEITNPRNALSTPLNDVLGDNELYTGSVSLKHDTRNSPIQASAGHYFEFSFEEAFGDFDYARIETEYRKYWLLGQRADFSGKQTLSYSTQLGFSGDQTPLFENFFAGGYATLRGFDFRGASPIDNGIEVGGRFQWLNTVEYMFPITADDAFRGVAFVDFGTVEQDIEINSKDFRVAPGLGLRVAIPMLGPAPLAFDFAYPVAKSEFDNTRVFSFYMSLIR